MRAVKLTDTPRGPIKFDHLGNVVGDFFIRRVEKANGKLHQQNAQDLSQRQSVLDLRREEVPRAAGLFAQLPAAEVVILTSIRGRPNRRPRFLRMSPKGEPVFGFMSLKRDGREKLRRYEFLAGADGQQRHVRWAAVSAVGGVLPDLRADADSEPDAWLAVHARRLYRRDSSSSACSASKLNFWLAAILATLAVAVLGALVERLLLRRLPGDQLAQVLVTLGLSFMVADVCLMVWGGDPLSVATPDGLGGFARFGVDGVPALPVWRSSSSPSSSPSGSGCCSTARGSAP